MKFNKKRNSYNEYPSFQNEKDFTEEFGTETEKNQEKFSNENYKKTDKKYKISYESLIASLAFRKTKIFAKEEDNFYIFNKNEFF